ncbi:TetR/AcrR family transcriptional regulator [Actinoplanes sp. NPDC049265]|uniref:TetR/AcrR family transcriptional regulator n=1 Tax=Actinoplanes sp. NPDC049265 TaxID=3363902 RepID=UPI00372067A9
MRTEIAAVAMHLFVTQGFAVTTVDQIAQTAGVSPRSLFRYFGTKEDIVLGDMRAAGEMVRDALRARPAAESPWDALSAAIAALGEVPGNTHERAFRLAEMFTIEPSLRARKAEKRRDWLDLLVPEVERRMGIDPVDLPDVRAHALVACALTCLDTGTEIWVRQGGTGNLGDLVNEALTVMRPHR